VETNLEKNFQLAHKWGCVLLLDEAEYVLVPRYDINRDRLADDNFQYLPKRTHGR
jgi:hypothetical protein